MRAIHVNRYEYDHADHVASLGSKGSGYSGSPRPPSFDPLKKTVLYLGGRAQRGDEGGKCNERMKGEADGSDTRIRICFPSRNGL